MNYAFYFRSIQTFIQTRRTPSVCLFLLFRQFPPAFLLLLLPVFLRRHAHHIPEGLGEFASVVIAEPAGHIQYGMIRLLQHQRRRVHFLSPDVGINRNTVKKLKDFYSGKKMKIKYFYFHCIVFLQAKFGRLISVK